MVKSLPRSGMTWCCTHPASPPCACTAIFFEPGSVSWDAICLIISIWRAWNISERVLGFNSTQDCEKLCMINSLKHSRSVDICASSPALPASGCLHPPGCSCTPRRSRLHARLSCTYRKTRRDCHRLSMSWSEVKAKLELYCHIEDKCISWPPTSAVGTCRG